MGFERHSLYYTKCRAMCFSIIKSVVHSQFQVCSHSKIDFNSCTLYIVHSTVYIQRIKRGREKRGRAVQKVVLCNSSSKGRFFFVVFFMQNQSYGCMEQ